MSRMVTSTSPVSTKAPRTSALHDWIVWRSFIETASQTMAFRLEPEFRTRLCPLAVTPADATCTNGHSTCSASAETSASRSIVPGSNTSTCPDAPQSSPDGEAAREGGGCVGQGNAYRQRLLDDGDGVGKDRPRNGGRRGD